MGTPSKAATVEATVEAGTEVEATARHRRRDRVAFRGVRPGEQRWGLVGGW